MRVVEMEMVTTEASHIELVLQGVGQHNEGEAGDVERAEEFGAGGFVEGAHATALVVVGEGDGVDEAVEAGGEVCCELGGEGVDFRLAFDVADVGCASGSSLATCCLRSSERTT